MITDPVFRTAPYQPTLGTRVRGLTAEGGIVPAASNFYPTGGGQPGDSGHLVWQGGRIAIATTLKGEAGAIVLLPAEAGALPPEGAEIELQLNWGRRHAHMRMHTALHLLSVVVPLPVTGGAIAEGRGRLDFDMPEPPGDGYRIERDLNALIARDLQVSDDWITDAELEANPGLVKTMSVRPPTGQGRVRLVRIGEGADKVDLQPCGGTHVARTGEIGLVSVAKIENKGRQNRRITLELQV
ncbi:MAG: alanyl-tRNA editing protein [Alphaproteobacteria bacterium]|nr:alanyl-tRNA editing protein [Alphaproteobacteria bacterium]